MLILRYASDEEWNSASNFVSKSRIGQFNMCPLKYKKQYVDNVVGYEETHATLIGSRFHEFAESFMLNCYKYPTDQWPLFISSDYNEEELPMLNYFINDEIDRYENGEFPLALEYRLVNENYRMRGLIDRIDLVDEDTINIIEYKTSTSINKQKLMGEFGFYSLLLDAVPELQDYKRKYTIINPRLQVTREMSASRPKTILNKIEKINNCISTGIWKPLCKGEYAVHFCDICTLEEIEYYNVEWRSHNESLRENE